MKLDFVDDKSIESINDETNEKFSRLIDNITLKNGKISYSDIDSNNSGRSESGVMFRDRIRSNVAKIELSWEMLTPTELEEIIQVISQSSFEVEYYFGDSIETEMYAGDKQMEKGIDDRWKLSVNFIEF